MKVNFFRSYRACYKDPLLNETHKLLGCVKSYPTFNFAKRKGNKGNTCVSICMERNLEEYVSYYLFPVMISRNSVSTGLSLQVFCVPFAFSISLCGGLNSGPQR